MAFLVVWIGGGGGGGSSRRWVKDCWKEGGGGPGVVSSTALGDLSLLFRGLDSSRDSLHLGCFYSSRFLDTLSRAVEERLSIGVALPVLLSKRW